ncbi:MAG: ATP-binding cassette domain-containing protein [Rhodospirillales bacterium]
MLMRALLDRLSGRPLVWAEVMLLSFVIALLSFAQPIFVIQVLNRYVAFGVDATLWSLTAGALAALTFELVFRRGRLALIGAANAAKDRALAEQAFALLNAAGMEGMTALTTAERRQVVNSVDSVRQAFQPSNMASMIDLPFAGLFVAGVWLLNTNLGIVAGLGLTAGILLIWLGGRSMRRNQSSLHEVLAARGGLVNASVLSPHTVRAFNGGDRMADLWGRADVRFRTLQGGISLSQGQMQALGQTLAAVVGVAIICVGALEVTAQRLDVGALIGANILGARALQPVLRLSGAMDAFAKARQAFMVLHRFRSMKRDRQTGTQIQNFSGRFALDDTTFTWSGASKPLYESLTFELAPGSVLIVVGDNGAGKTTLARMLVGLLHPQRGAVRADGVDIRQLDPTWWHRQLIYFPQEPVFLPGTVRDAITGLNPELDEAAVGRLVETAGLRTYIAELSDGIETPIKDGGTDMSLGTRRRLALARALASDGRIAIMDEPLEAMDSEGRRIMTEVVRALSSMGRTLIIFSHEATGFAGPRKVLDLNVKPTPTLTEYTDETPQAAAAEGQAQLPAPASAPASAGASALAAGQPQAPLGQPQTKLPVGKPAVKKPAAKKPAAVQPTGGTS